MCSSNGCLSAWVVAVTCERVSSNVLYAGYKRGSNGGSIHTGIRPLDNHYGSTVYGGTHGAPFSPRSDPTLGDPTLGSEQVGATTCVCSSIRSNHGTSRKKNRHLVNERGSFLSFSFVMSRSSAIHHEMYPIVLIPDETTRIGVCRCSGQKP